MIETARIKLKSLGNIKNIEQLLYQTPIDRTLGWFIRQLVETKLYAWQHVAKLLSHKTSFQSSKGKYFIVTSLHSLENMYGVQK